MSYPGYDIVEATVMRTCSAKMWSSVQRVILNHRKSYYPSGPITIGLVDGPGDKDNTAKLHKPQNEHEAGIDSKRKYAQEFVDRQIFHGKGLCATLRCGLTH